jgi:threonyl-tRNA synthetase
VMIHRAPFGSFERFLGVLIEHLGGNFPLWLAPEQVAILPISDKVAAFAAEVSDYLKRHGFRCFVDDRNEKIGRKIRDNEVRKVPYMLVVGEKEAASGQVSVRRHGQGDLGGMTLDAFGERLKDDLARNA